MNNSLFEVELAKAQLANKTENVGAVLQLLHQIS